MFYPVKFLSVALLLSALGTQIHAQQSSSVSLSRWLNQEVAVQLADKLANHPKFKGQALRVGTIIDGQPAPRSNRLALSLQNSLSHHILRQGRNDIVLPNSNSCLPPRSVHYFLGVSIQSLSKLTHRVHIGMLDLKDHHWVSGISYSWQGRLSSSERARLKQPVNMAVLGSPDRPFARLGDPKVFDALATQIRCSNILDWRGSVHIQTNPDPTMQTLLADLGAQLAQSGWSVSRQADEADWLLTGAVKASRHGSERVRVHLADNAAQGQDKHTQRHRLGTVYVTRQTQLTEGTASPPMAATHVPAVSAPVRYKSPIIKHFKKVRDSACKGCITVSVELRHPAQLLVFSSQADKLQLLSCDASAQMRSPGTYQFRIRSEPLPAYHARPSMGVYVVAGSDPAQMQVMADALRSAAKGCNPDTTSEHTRALLQQVSLLQPGDNLSTTSLQWAALHYQKRPYGLVKLNSW